MSKLNFTVHTMRMITEEPVSSKVTPFLKDLSLEVLPGILDIFIQDLVESFNRKEEDLTEQQRLIRRWYQGSTPRIVSSSARQLLLFLSAFESLIPDGEENKKTSEEAEGEEK